MATPSRAREGHVVLRVVLMTLAISVLLASVVMWWWVRQYDDGDIMAGQVTPAAQQGESAG
jgi:hypothetical protein